MAQPYAGTAPAPAPAPAPYPMPGPMPAQPPRTGNLGSILGIAALALAVIALVVAAVFPGPVGPAGAAGLNGTNGAQGPQGPAGPGSLMNYSMAAPWTSGGLPLVGCVNVLVVNLTVPRAGTFAVDATVHVWVEHTSGTTDEVDAQVAVSAGDCSESNSSRVGYVVDVPSSAPSSSLINVEGSFVNGFTAPAAGRYTYYLNIEMALGQSAGDAVSEASMTVTFYPG